MFPSYRNQSVDLQSKVDLHIILVITVILTNMLDMKILRIFREFILITKYPNHLQDI